MTVPKRPPFDFARVRERDPETVGLSFSNGKDSLAAWLYLREEGFKVIPFYLALVADLEFIERSLKYYEAFFGTRIYRLTHPNFGRLLKNHAAQPVHRSAPILDAFCWSEAVDVFDYKDAEVGFRRTAGLKPNAWIAVGTKKSDSAMRAHHAGTGYNRKRQTFAPLNNWSTADISCILHDYECPLPVDYELFGRSFDGTDSRFIAPLRDRFPADYARILEWYPLSALEAPRSAVAEAHNLSKGRRTRA